MTNQFYFGKEHLARHLAIVFVYCALLGFILYWPAIQENWLPTSSDNKLFLITYSDVLSEDILQKFTEKTGIAIYKKYVENDAEMLMQANLNDGAGYDIVTPTDHIAKVMFKQDLFDNLNAHDLPEINNLTPYFKQRCLADRQGLKGVPFGWTFHGLGFKKTFFENRGLKLPDCLAYVFDPLKIYSIKALQNRLRKYRVCVLDNAQELFYLTSVYAFGSVQNFSAEKVERIYEILKYQKPWVQAYTDSDVSYYLQHCVPVLLALAAHIKRTVGNNPKFAFAIPKDGSIITIQQCCIPKKARNKQLAHEFVKFILDPETQADMFNETGFAPSNKNAMPMIEPRFANDKNFFPDEETMNKFHSINDLISPVETENLLLRVKAN